MSPGALIIAAGCGLTAFVAMYGIAVLLSPARRAQTRVEALASVGSVYALPDVTLMRDRRTSSIGAVDALLSGKAFTERTGEQLAQSGLPLRVGEYLAIRLAALVFGVAIGLLLGVGAGSGVLVVTGIVVGAAAGLLLPPLVVRQATRRRAAAIEAQLVELCDIMASMLQSGYGYVQALSATAAEIGQPLSSEIGRLLEVVQLGGDVDEALEEVNRRLNSRDFDMIATAISIQRRSGGNLSEILQGVSATIRDRQALKREVRTLTAQQRFAAVIVSSFPFILLALLTLISRDTYSLLFTEFAGRIMLGLIVVLDLAAYAWIWRVSQVEA